MTTQQLGRPQGKTGQAKVLNNKELKIIDTGHHAKRNTAIVILSHYLGLRFKELASLKISDVVETNGQIKKVLCLLLKFRSSKIEATY